jgi:hypothetical protein
MLWAPVNKVRGGGIIMHFIVTERRGRVHNTPASYSGGLGFKSQHWRPAILIEGFRGFSQFFQANVGIVP